MYCDNRIGLPPRVYRWTLVLGSWWPTSPWTCGLVWSSYDDGMHLQPKTRTEGVCGLRPSGPFWPFGAGRRCGWNWVSFGFEVDL